MMRIEIEIPKEFEVHFNRDKFEDTLHRLSADAHLIAGNYEQETAIMLIDAFKESKPAYDVDKVVEQLKDYRSDFIADVYEILQSEPDNNNANHIIDMFEKIWNFVIWDIQKKLSF